jgi:hypothetical protein
MMGRWHFPTALTIAAVAGLLNVPSAVAQGYKYIGICPSDMRSLGAFERCCPAGNQACIREYGRAGTQPAEDGSLVVYSNGVFGVGTNNIELRIKNTSSKVTYRLLSYSVYNCSGTGAGQCGTRTNGAGSWLMALGPGQDRSLTVVGSGNTDAQGNQPAISFQFSWRYVGSEKGAGARTGSSGASAPEVSN